MDRVRWSGKAIPFRSLVDNPAIQKPALVQIGTKAIVVGEKINGEFIMASPCKVSGDRFDVMEEEIVVSSKHTGVWRVISKAASQKEGYIHRLTVKDLERIHRKDSQNERSTPRSYICIRSIEAFELIMRHNDPAVSNGQRIERRVKQIEENTEFDILDCSEVEYTPSEGERTSQDYVAVPKNKHGGLLQLFLPNLIEHEQLIRNRVVRALHCTTKGETRQRSFLLEVNEQPCEIRPIASEGSTELRYLHSTQNLYDYMLTYGNDAVLYVKLLRGDPPIKAIEFDGYMVLKSTLNGYKIPICRVEDLEITLVSPDLPVRVKLPAHDEQVWRSSAEIRAAEVQCMQLSLALLARHESEMYVTIEEEKDTRDYLESNYNQEQGALHTGLSSRSLRKHREECEKVFGQSRPTKLRADDGGRPPTQSTARQLRNLTLGNREVQRHQSTGPSKANTLPRTHTPSDRLYRLEEKRFVRQDPLANPDESSSSSSHSRNRRTTARQVPLTSAPFATTHSLKSTSNMY